MDQLPRQSSDQATLANTEIIYPKNVRAKLAMDFRSDKYLAHRTIEKMKIWEPFWRDQVNSTANPDHLTQNWAKLAKSTVLFSWWL